MYNAPPADYLRGTTSDRAPLGLLIAVLGAAVLAISVFQPWYGVSIVASGGATARQELAVVAHDYGNPAIETRPNGARVGSLAGRQLATVSAHQTMKHVSLILLGLAGIALLASVLRLADMRGALRASGSQVALLGGLAAGVVVFRMVRPPDPAVNLVSLSLSLTWGIWLALLSAALVVAGGLIAGSARTDWRRRPKVGPGPPPLRRDIASPLATARARH
jgi:hypothetical protein